MIFYHPQRSCEGYVFTPVCLSTGGLPQCMLGYHHTPPGPGTPRAGTPLEQATRPAGTGHPPAPNPPPRAGTHQPPQTRQHPTEQAPTNPPRLGTPQSRHPPGPDTPPGPDPPSPPADGYCCGRYASCWNAFSFLLQWVL